MANLRFEQLITWQKSRQLVVAVYRTSEEGAFGEDRALHEQIRRAAVSILCNIAEGAERYGRREFSHFLSIAKGSAGEVRCRLHIAYDLGSLPTSTFTTLRVQCDEVSRLLAGLRASLRPNPPGK